MNNRITKHENIYKQTLFFILFEDYLNLYSVYIWQHVNSFASFLSVIEIRQKLSDCNRKEKSEIKNASFQLIDNHVISSHSSHDNNEYNAL